MPNGPSPEFSSPDQDIQPSTEMPKSKEAEIFKAAFNPREYLERDYPEVDVARVMPLLDRLQQIPDKVVDLRPIAHEMGIPLEAAENLSIFNFQRRVAGELLTAFPGDHIDVLDVGGGPTIYQHIPIALEAGRIIHSEFLEQNRKEVSRWLNDESSAYDWDSYFSLMQALLQRDSAYQAALIQQSRSEDQQTRAHAISVQEIVHGPLEEYKAYLRQRMVGVVAGDVFRPNLGLADGGKEYDAVTSSSREGAAELITSNFAIESATGDKRKWELGMQHIMQKVKPDGYLALSAIRDATWYRVGDERMPAARINEDDVIRVLSAGGFSTIYNQVFMSGDKHNDGYEGMMYTLAHKGRAVKNA